MNIPAEPELRIMLGAVVGIVPVLFVTLIESGGDLFAVLGVLVLIAISAFLGPFLGLWHTITTDFQISYVIAVLLSIAMISAGLKYRKYVVGQIGAVLGIYFWTLCGLGGVGIGA
tara:strand:- start:998 stop:1342 length:345 start_codon:yes stop_codon:yes gene_type:complete